MKNGYAVLAIGVLALALTACNQESQTQTNQDVAKAQQQASKDVADALAAKNFTIDRRKVQLDDPIKQLGEYKVPVRLHKDVTAEVTVHVVKEE